MKTKLSKNVTDIVLMIFGSLLMAVGVYFFKVPNGFSTGGVSGISTVLSPLIPFITPGAMMFVINMLLLVVGFIFVSNDTGWKTSFCSIVFSGFTWLFEFVFPLAAPLTDQPLLELVYAIMLTGVGSAVLFNVNASSGGTDIVALLLKKYTALNVGNALLITDCLIAASSFLVFGLKAGLFSMAGLFAKAFLVDGVIESLNICKSFTIITDKPDEIIEYIIKDMHHSATVSDAKGAYTHEDKKMIVTLCRRPEAAKLKQKVREIDAHAFVIVQTTSEIIGKGFRSI